MDGLEIRNFQVGDVKEILGIHRENEEFFEELKVTEEFILNIGERDDFKFFIAELDSQVIGFLGILFHPGVGRAEAGPIGIKNGYKNREVGKKLMQRGMEFLKEKEIKRVISKVKFKNTLAIKFFESLGFQQEAHFKNYTKKGEDIVQLVKFL